MSWFQTRRICKGFVSLMLKHPELAPSKIYWSSHRTFEYIFDQNYDELTTIGAIILTTGVVGAFGMRKDLVVILKMKDKKD